MSERDQVDALYKDLTALLQRYIDEFDLSTAAAIGALHMKIHEITCAAMDGDED